MGICASSPVDGKGNNNHYSTNPKPNTSNTPKRPPNHPHNNKPYNKNDHKNYETDGEVNHNTNRKSNKNINPDVKHRVQAPPCGNRATNRRNSTPSPTHQPHRHPLAVDHYTDEDEDSPTGELWGQGPRSPSQISHSARSRNQNDRVGLEIGNNASLRSPQNDRLGFSPKNRQPINSQKSQPDQHYENPLQLPQLHHLASPFPTAASSTHSTHTNTSKSTDRGSSVAPNNTIPALRPAPKQVILVYENDSASSHPSESDSQTSTNPHPTQNNPNQNNSSDTPLPNTKHHDNRLIDRALVGLCEILSMDNDEIDAAQGRDLVGIGDILSTGPSDNTSSKRGLNYPSHPNTNGANPPKHSTEASAQSVVHQPHEQLDLMLIIATADTNDEARNDLVMLVNRSPEHFTQILYLIIKTYLHFDFDQCVRLIGILKVANPVQFIQNTSTNENPQLQHDLIEYLEAATFGFLYRYCQEQEAALQLPHLHARANAQFQKMCHILFHKGFYNILVHCPKFDHADPSIRFKWITKPIRDECRRQAVLSILPYQKPELLDILLYQFISTNPESIIYVQDLLNLSVNPHTEIEPPTYTQYQRQLQGRREPQPIQQLPLHQQPQHRTPTTLTGYLGHSTHTSHVSQDQQDASTGDLSKKGGLHTTNIIATAPYSPVPTTLTVALSSSTNSSAAPTNSNVSAQHAPQFGRTGSSRHAGASTTSIQTSNTNLSAPRQGYSAGTGSGSISNLIGNHQPLQTPTRRQSILNNVQTNRATITIHDKNTTTIQGKPQPQQFPLSKHYHLPTYPHLHISNSHGDSHHSSADTRSLGIESNGTNTASKIPSINTNFSYNTFQPSPRQLSGHSPTNQQPNNNNNPTPVISTDSNNDPTPLSPRDLVPGPTLDKISLDGKKLVLPGHIVINANDQEEDSSDISPLLRPLHPPIDCSIHNSYDDRNNNTASMTMGDDELHVSHGTNNRESQFVSFRFSQDQEQPSHFSPLPISPQLPLSTLPGLSNIPSNPSHFSQEHIHFTTYHPSDPTSTPHQPNEFRLTTPTHVDPPHASDSSTTITPPVLTVSPGVVPNSSFISPLPDLQHNLGAQNTQANPILNLANSPPRADPLLATPKASPDPSHLITPRPSITINTSFNPLVQHPHPYDLNSPTTGSNLTSPSPRLGPSAFQTASAIATTTTPGQSPFLPRQSVTLSRGSTTVPIRRLTLTPAAPRQSALLSHIAYQSPLQPTQLDRALAKGDPLLMANIEAYRAELASEESPSLSLGPNHTNHVSNSLSVTTPSTHRDLPADPTLNSSPTLKTSAIIQTQMRPNPAPTPTSGMGGLPNRPFQARRSILAAGTAPSHVLLQQFNSQHSTFLTTQQSTDSHRSTVVPTPPSGGYSTLASPRQSITASTTPRPRTSSAAFEMSPHAATTSLRSQTLHRQQILPDHHQNQIPSSPPTIQNSPNDNFQSQKIQRPITTPFFRIFELLDLVLARYTSRLTKIMQSCFDNDSEQEPNNDDVSGLNDQIPPKLTTEQLKQRLNDKLNLQLHSLFTLLDLFCLTRPPLTQEEKDAKEKQQQLLNKQLEQRRTMADALKNLLKSPKNLGSRIKNKMTLRGTMNTRLATPSVTNANGQRNYVDDQGREASGRETMMSFAAPSLGGVAGIGGDDGSFNVARPPFSPDSLGGGDIYDDPYIHARMTFASGRISLMSPSPALQSKMTFLNQHLRKNMEHVEQEGNQDGHSNPKNTTPSVSATLTPGDAPASNLPKTPRLNVVLFDTALDDQTKPPNSPQPPSYSRRPSLPQPPLSTPQTNVNGSLSGRQTEDEYWFLNDVDFDISQYDQNDAAVKEYIQIREEMRILHQAQTDELLGVNLNNLPKAQISIKHFIPETFFLQNEIEKIAMELVRHPTVRPIFEQTAFYQCYYQQYLDKQCEG